MKFIVRRVSWFDTRPTEDALMESYVHVDRRTFKTLEEAESRVRFVSDGKGTNHRVIEDGVARDMDSSDWMVEIESLGDLAAWGRREKHEVIIDFTTEPPRLTIYDGYIE